MRVSLINGLITLSLLLTSAQCQNPSDSSNRNPIFVVSNNNYYSNQDGGQSSRDKYPEDYFFELGTGNENNDRGLFPSIFNLASNAIITTNATCGTRGAESFCKLVEHVYMRKPQCDVCDNNQPYKRHPIEFAVDGTNRWWQSPTLATGLVNEWVTIKLDLRQQYQVAYVIIKSAIAPRPGNWILERSLDDKEWKPWQYYAITDEECERTYGIKASPNVARFDTDDQVICTSWYSRLDPIEDGEIHTSLVNGRPGIDGPSLSLQNFTKARYIRFRFQHLKTLNSDLIYITRRQGAFTIDESVTRRYFYAIRDISVGGQCICYGHAEHCPADPSTGQLRCDCKHNTCGDSCHECCPLFNQKQWRHGTITQQHACEACQCFNHADSCKYDADIEVKRLSLTPEGLYEGGGVCVDCKHNTQGLNCEACKDNYFRPAGVSHYQHDACRPCDCEPTGSTDTICIKDETHTSEGLKPGDCKCKLGFGGTRCDRCALGFRNYPVCDPCPCNRAGSANFATCDNTCMCKRNVEGTFCDKCKKGYFNLDEDNPDGCTPCFCFGKTKECSELNWGKEMIRDMTNWTLTDMDLVRDVALPTNGSSVSVLTINVREVPDRSLFYWKAPSAFRGNLLTSYNGDLKYYVYYVTAGSGHPMPIPDVILKGNGITIEHHSRRSFYEKENVSMSIRFHENSDWYDRTARTPVDKTKFMSVLANVEAFMIRATYHQAQVQSSLYSVTLETATRQSTAVDRVSSVEQCSCPENFVGLSCETCVDGYRRVNNELYDGKCEICKCNDHSTKCDPFTGFCMDCKHSTMGPRCEHCITGYYGNPLLSNSEGACKKCGCPLTDEKNNFSPTCMIAGTEVMESKETEYICTGCPPGHMGNKCEWCADGFFGDPLVPGNYCQPCACNENIDQAAIGNCDRKSGQCLKCIGNTEGFNCENCKPNHFGDALKHNCRACGCNMFGSITSQCNLQSGECECKEHYVGYRCDRCEDGFGDVENNCPACNCDNVGSHSDRCDPLSGQCQCKPGVFGKRCDVCATGYFGLSVSGCRYCGCYAAGSEDEGKCDTTTGQCFCKPHVTGQMCTICEEGFFNITSGKGCQPCECHEQGANDKMCEQLTGQCKCKYGVTGPKCDKCDSNFYGLSSDGCKQCQICPAAGHVCDSVTGECVCPPFTIGDMCESCAVDTWDYDPYKGCKACACDSAGSTGTSCDLNTGACVCRPGYTGKKCDQCTHGHFKFPACLKCECHVAGTQVSSCSATSGCSCDETGQCPCKKNVIKEKCTECDPNSFSLEADNPKGCTECFCFNRTNFCIQSSYIFQQIGAEPRKAIFEKPWLYWEMVHGLQVLPAEPATLYSYPTDHTPIYWPLPGQFLADKATSYNGYLRFRVTNANGGNYLEGDVPPDSRFFEQYPMVVLVGNHRIILEHFKKASQIDHSGIYLIKFREDLWKSRHKPEIPVSRQTLMTALQNVQAIYVRGTYIERVSKASLNDITMDVGVFDNSTTTTINNTAIGVEQCDCPQGYSGLSCQMPAEGYCRKKMPNYLDSKNDLDLVGTSELCNCNSHSTTCDRETCRCQDCQHNTVGDFCDRCSVGFYGNAKLATPDACKKCACPTESHSFSKSCYAVNYGEGYVCDQCQVGHTGLYCESCISGFYGDPMNKEACRECSCNRYGSLSNTCDTKDGQCLCRPGVTGRDCSECQPRHALIGADCQSCDVGCTRELMVDVDALELQLENYNFTGLVPAPWGHLARLENETKALKQLNADINRDDENTKDIVGRADDIKKHLTEARELLKEAKYIDEKANKSNVAIESLVESADKLMNEIGTLFKKIRDIHDLLVRYRVSGTVDRAIPVNVTKWVLEASDLLREMENTTRYLEKRFNLAEQALLDAKELLIEVKKKTFNDTTLKVLGAKLANITMRLEDAKRYIWEDVRKNLTNSESIMKITEKMLTEFKRISTIIEELRKDAEDQATSATDKKEGAQKLLTDVLDQYGEINNTLINQLMNATEQCETRANYLEGLLPDYRERFLFPAQKHAEDLELNAAKLYNSFAPIKVQSELPLHASAAYTNIKDAIETASVAAEAAKDAADKTYKEVFADDSIVLRSKASLNKSQELLEKAQSLSTSDMSDSLKNYEKRLTGVAEKNVNTRKAVAEMEPRIDKFDNIAVEVEITGKDAKAARVRADAVLNKTTILAEQVAALNEKMKQTAGSTGKGVTNLVAEVENVRSGVELATTQLTDLQEQAIKNREKMDDVSQNLAFLKEKINEAREKASKIKISVQSKEPDTCIRSYFSPALPSPSNMLSIDYRPTDDVQDSLIFITKTNQTRSRPDTEFLALELRDRRFVFIWNVGNNAAAFKQVTVPYTVMAVAKKAYQSWYQIDVERKGNYANLTITLPHLLSEKPYSVSMQFADNDDSMIIFNTLLMDTKVYLGIKENEKPLGIKNNEFRGTIGKITFDGYTLPLWNFVDDSNTCKGYYPPAAGEEATDPSYMFSDGYAQIPATGPNRPLITNLWITFSSYSENGLIYFRGNPSSKDFVSLELEDGRLKAQFNLGGNSKMSLYSNKHYNDGKKYSVQLNRDQLLVEFQITGVETEKFSDRIPGKFSQLDADSDHLLGGVPESYPKKEFKSFNIQWQGFYGCIDSKVKSEVYLNFQSANKTYNMRPGCTFSGSSATDVLVTNDRVVSFESSGYFVISGFEFGPNSSLSINFRSSRSSGLLFYQSSQVSTRRRRQTTNGKGFIAGYLYDSTFVFTMSDQDILTLQTSTKVCDGQLHTIFIKRDNTEVSLFVDDRFEKKETLQNNHLVGSTGGQLFLGGLGRIVPPSNELPIYSPFVGCISDIYLNFKRVSLIPVRLENATLGKCLESSYAKITTDRGMNVQGTEPLMDEHAFDEYSPAALKNSRLLLDAAEIIDEFQDTDPAQKWTTKKVVRTTAKMISTTEASASSCISSEYLDDITNAELYGLKVDSFSGLNYRKNITDIRMTMQFRTKRPSGTLIAWPNKDYQNYFFIILEKSILNLVLKIGKMKTPLVLTSDQTIPLSDGYWHSVSFIKKNDSISLQVDNNPEAYQDKLPKKWSLKRSKGALMVGGCRRTIAKKFNIPYEPLSGCIKNFYLNGKIQDLSKNSRGTEPCRNAMGSSLFFRSTNGSVTVDAWPSNKISKFFLEFRSDNVLDGQILTAVNGNSYFSLKLASGQISIEFTDKRESADSMIYSMTFETASLCDNSWHKIAINLDGDKIVLDGSYELPIPLSDDLQMFSKAGGQFFIGTLPENVASKLSIEPTPGLVGCIRNMQINGGEVNFENYPNMRLVALNECPF